MPAAHTQQKLTQVTPPPPAPITVMWKSPLGVGARGVFSFPNFESCYNICRFGQDLVDEENTMISVAFIISTGIMFVTRSVQWNIWSASNLTYGCHISLDNLFALKYHGMSLDGYHPPNAPMNTCHTSWQLGKLSNEPKEHPNGRILYIFL